MLIILKADIKATTNMAALPIVLFFKNGRHNRTEKCLYESKTNISTYCRLLPYFLIYKYVACFTVWVGIVFRTYTGWSLKKQQRAALPLKSRYYMVGQPFVSLINFNGWNVTNNFP